PAGMPDQADRHALGDLPPPASPRRARRRAARRARPPGPLPLADRGVPAGSGPYLKGCPARRAAVVGAAGPSASPVRGTAAQDVHTAHTVHAAIPPTFSASSATFLLPPATSAMPASA